MQNQNQTKAEIEAKKAEIKRAEAEAKAAEAKQKAEKAELKRLEQKMKAEEAEARKSQTVLRDDMCKNVIRKFKEHREIMIRFKKWVFSEVAAYMDLLRSVGELEETGKLGSSKHFLSSDGLIKIECSRAMQTRFNENMNIAEEHLRKYLESKVDDGSVDLVEMIEAMLAKNKAGAYNPTLVDKLLNMSIDNDNFKQAKEWILKAREVCGNKDYVRVYERETIKSEWNYIDLSFSKLPI